MLLKSPRLTVSLAMMVFALIISGLYAQIVPTVDDRPRDDFSS